MLKVFFYTIFCFIVLFKSSQTISIHHDRTNVIGPFSSVQYNNNPHLKTLRTKNYSLESQNQVFLQLNEDQTDAAVTAAAQAEETRKANEELLKKLEEERRLHEERKLEEEKRKKEEVLKQALDKMAKDDLERIENLIDNIKSKLNSFSQEVNKIQNQIGTQLQDEIKASIQKIEDQLKAHYTHALDHATKGNLKYRKVIDDLTLEIRQEINKLYKKSDVNFCNMKELTIMLLQYQVNDNTKQLNQFQAQADALQKTLPPSKSICNEYLECGICNANPKCGWCVTKNKCVEADKRGPLCEPCALFDYDICRGFNCAFYKDCKSCIEDSRCGWCDDFNDGGKTCLERPAIFQGCPSDHWYHSEGSFQQCPQVIIEPFLDVKKAEETERAEKLRHNRNRELELQERQMTQDEKNLQESQSQLIKLKQSVLTLKKENQRLNTEINKIQNEIKDCQAI